MQTSMLMTLSRFSMAPEILDERVVAVDGTRTPIDRCSEGANAALRGLMAKFKVKEPTVRGEIEWRLRATATGESLGCIFEVDLRGM